MSLAELLGKVVSILNRCDIPSMLTGSFAGAYYALPRATQDIDLVVDATHDKVDDLVRMLSEEGMYVNEEAVHEALQLRGQFNVVDPQSGWKVDLIVRKDRSFSVVEFSRRKPATIHGVAVTLTSLEDLILIKLEWSRMGDSERQRRDVLQLVEAGWETIDREYIDRWAATLGLQKEWTELLGRISSSREGDG